jgi:hypothetical protein
VSSHRTSSLTVFQEFLPQTRFELLHGRVSQLDDGERVHLPIHKRGATIAYETLQRIAPEVVEFYKSEGLLQTISSFAGEAVLPTPPHDQSSCSILIYDREGDHIGWHYDWNFYAGRHFTALLPFINRNAAGTGSSSAELLIQTHDGPEIVPTPPNQMIVFEGALVRHCVRRLSPNEKRVVLSMTFCTNPGASTGRSIIRRFKDIAYFGPRALWT